MVWLGSVRVWTVERLCTPRSPSLAHGLSTALHPLSIRSSRSQSSRSLPSLSRKRAICSQACKTVVWSRPPKASPISGKLWSVSSLAKAIAICRARTRERALPRKKVGEPDAVILGDDALDIGDVRLLLLGVQQVAQGLLGKLHRDRSAKESGPCAQGVEGSFEIANVRTHPPRDQEGDLLRQSDPRARALLSKMAARVSKSGGSMATERPQPRRDFSRGSRLSYSLG